MCVRFCFCLCVCVVVVVVVFGGGGKQSLVHWNIYETGCPLCVYGGGGGGCACVRAREQNVLAHHIFFSSRTERK